MQIRYHFLFFLLLLFVPHSLSALPYDIRASSCEESPLYAPENAFDKDNSTRWSSRFKDDEWLEIDFGSTTDIAGFVLFWEDAYALEYAVHVSSDAKKWSKVYETQFGDGGRDEFYFDPVRARYVRFVFLKRATGWGFSLWDIEALTPDDKPSAQFENKIIDSLFDADPLTGWTTRIGDARSIVIDLKRLREIGGLDLELVSSSTDSIGLSCTVSKDGINFESVSQYGETKVYQVNRTLPVIQRVRFEARSLQFLKLTVSGASADDSMTLSGVTIKEANAGVGDPYRAYEERARTQASHVLPRYFRGEQRYWMVTGLPHDERDLAVAEDGTIEYGFSIRPFIFVNGSFITDDMVSPEHRLLDGHLPIPLIKWSHPEWVMTEEVVVAGDSENTHAYVQIRFLNRSEKSLTGKVYVTLEPFSIHPKWLYGSLLPIRSIAKEENTIFINNLPRLKVTTPIDGFSAVSFLGGNNAADIMNGASLVSRETHVHDPTKCASGVLEFGFDLARGEEKVISYTLSMRGESEPTSYEEAFTQSSTLWRDLLRARDWQIPDPRFRNALLANLAYALVNMTGVRLQPGSRVYGKTWMRDGAITSSALLRMGFFDEVKTFLRWMASRQKEDGRIPFTITDEGEPSYVSEWKEYDSEGEFIYAVAECYRFTRDTAFLSQMEPHVTRALQFLKARLSERKAKEYEEGSALEKAMYGILPDSNSHEGYFPSRHSYWDNYWALRAFREALFIDSECGITRENEWVKKEEERLTRALKASLVISMKEHAISYIPGCVELGDFDPNAPAVALFPCNVQDALPDGGLEFSLNKYFNEVFQRRKSSHGETAFSGYELRNAVALLMLGDKTKAHQIIESFFTYMRPFAWHAWSETIFTNPREGGYLGDIPHSWVGSIFINFSRSIFVYEKEDSLILLSGVPDEWFMSEEGFRVKDLPTWFGHLSLSLAKNQSTVSVRITGEALPPKGFFLHVPNSFQVISSFPLDGEKSKHGIRFFSLPFHCELARAPE
jgi:hypothetical protein